MQYYHILYIAAKIYFENLFDNNRSEYTSVVWFTTNRVKFLTYVWPWLQYIAFNKPCFFNLHRLLYIGLNNELTMKFIILINDLKVTELWSFPIRALSQWRICRRPSLPSEVVKTILHTFQNIQDEKKIIKKKKIEKVLENVSKTVKKSTIFFRPN